MYICILYYLAVTTLNNSKFGRTEKIAFIDNTYAIKYLITIRPATSVQSQIRSKVCIVVNKSIYYIICTTNKTQEAIGFLLECSVIYIDNIIILVDGTNKSRFRNRFRNATRADSPLPYGRNTTTSECVRAQIYNINFTIVTDSSVTITYTVENGYCTNKYKQ